jgi:hypothetical protein
MIKVVSTYLAADICRIERVGDAQKAGRFVVTAKRGFGSYPPLDNALCLSSVVIGGRELGARCRAIGMRLPKGADSAGEHGQQWQGQGLPGSRQLSAVIDGHGPPGCRCFAIII